MERYPREKSGALAMGGCPAVPGSCASTVRSQWGTTAGAFLRKGTQKVHGLKLENVREIQGNKWEDRSGFDAGVVLVRVEE